MTTFTDESFVSDCYDALAEGERASRAVHELVERAVSAPSDIAAAVGDATASPMMRTWYRSGELTVLHIVWPPGVDLFAHDHNMWAAIGIYGGREDNQYFRRLDDGSIRPSTGTSMLAGDSVLLGRRTVHAVANPTREWTAALHVYGGDFFAVPRTTWSADTLEPTPLDPASIVDTLERAATAARDA